MHCILYARVSTGKQADKELSIPAQLQAMRQYAKDRDWIILEEFVEAGVSARTVDRPTLRQLLQRCRDSEPTKVDVVLVHKIDRFARNLADHVAIRAQLRERGVALASVTESLEDSVSGQLVEHILASMAEFYSANLSEEVKKGMRQKILQGGWPHRPPRGYRIVRDGLRSTFAIDETDGPLIRKAFELCRFGYRGIVDLRFRLASMGFRTRTGRPVANSYVVSLLKNPFYCGQLRWKGEIYQGAQPALVPVQFFEEVQDILKRRSRPLIRRKIKFLLSGLARCAKCGNFVGSEEHRRWKYYRCRSSFRNVDRCRVGMFNVAVIHRDLERLLQGMALSAGVRATLVRLATDADLEVRRSLRGLRGAIRLQLAGLIQREGHLTRAFAEGYLTQNGYNTALKQLAEQRASLEDELGAVPSPDPQTLQRLRAVAAHGQSAWDVYVLLDLPEQRVLIETLFERLELAPQGIARAVPKGMPEDRAA